MQDTNYTIIAHRGGGGAEFPENSLSAIKSTVEKGKADRIEIDIHQTKDNVLVVMHDKSINRTTTGKGMIKNLLYQELREYHLKGSCDKEEIPSLEEVIKITINRLNSLLIFTLLILNCLEDIFSVFKNLPP